jgi:hypothetical protein
MAYRIDAIVSFCEEFELNSRRVEPNRVEVDFDEDGTLVFLNLPEEDDTLIGFDGTPWHVHDKLTLMTGESTYVELDELQVLQGIKSGNILVVSRYVSNELVDRFLAHKDRKIDVKHIETKEEVRVKRLA